MKTTEYIQRLLDETKSEIVWDAGLPMGDEQTDAMFYRGASNFVATVKSGDFEVDIYCDGVTQITDRTNDNRYYDGADLIAAGYDTDKKLEEATESGDLVVDNNSWFDLYVKGEHLDAVTHEILDAVRSALEFLDEERRNAMAIENVGADF